MAPQDEGNDNRQGSPVCGVDQEFTACVCVGMCVVQCFHARGYNLRQKEESPDLFVRS